MNFNPETMEHYGIYNVKYTQPNTLYEPVLLKPLKQIIVSHAMFKVTSFVDIGPCLKSFSSLQRYIR